jgi:oxygen-independent coproporphyrinogen-3 oxidase
MSAGVYLHIPFCKSRCSYCDFATDIYRSENEVQRYVDALCTEIEAFEPTGANPSGSGGAPTVAFTLPTSYVSALTSDKRITADALYFGGGTPSLLSPSQVKSVLGAVNASFDVNEATEITMEMNPATVTAESLQEYKALGVNRASFGVQTFNDRALKLLARAHDAADARETYEMLRDAGFENISFDLIAGLPGQTINDWKRNLKEAIKLSPEHLSLYLLEIHEGTPLAEQVRSGRRPVPDENRAAEMYDVMCCELAKAGYQQYEISNFAKPGFESRHNTKYWRLEPVYGFGVSAHSFDGTERYLNDRDTTNYVRQIEESGNAEVTRETIDSASESVFLGLRLDEGVNLEAYARRFKIDLRATHGPDLARLQEYGLIEIQNDLIKLTSKGKLFSNEVFAVFV